MSLDTHEQLVQFLTSAPVKMDSPSFWESLGVSFDALYTCAEDVTNSYTGSDSELLIIWAEFGARLALRSER